MSALFFIVSLADLFSVIDLHAFLMFLGVPEGKVGGAVAFVSFVFLFLRWLTTTPMFMTLQQGDVVVAVPEVMAAHVEANAAEVRADLKASA